jgi:type IV secretory pathway TrbF-like protein
LAAEAARAGVVVDILRSGAADSRNERLGSARIGGSVFTVLGIGGAANGAALATGTVIGVAGGVSLGGGKVTPMVCACTITGSARQMACIKRIQQTPERVGKEVFFMNASSIIG